MNRTTGIGFYFILVFLQSIALHAQADKTSALFLDLKEQDSIFFERGFNRCDLEYLESHIAPDLNFFHDQSGFQDRDAFFRNTKQYICSDPAKKPIRKVDVNSLEVFPLYTSGKLYAAIQKGTHHFYIRESGKEDVHTGTALFTNVWLLKGKDWLLKEVLSYDHKEPEEIPAPELNEIEELLKKYKVPALGLGIINNGKLTNIEVYGSLDQHQRAPYNTIFKVASLTKPVFALTVLKLVDAGLLDLHEPLYTYWTDPDLKKDSRHKKLTPFLVLTHQTGFPNWRYMTASKKLQFQFDPGEKYQYSGEGFEYLRKAIEIKLGRSIEDLAQELIIDPVGMTDTSFWWEASVEESRYAQSFDEKGEIIENQKYYDANAAANLLTSVEDYGKFLAYVINGAGLSKELFDSMQSRHVKLKENDFFGLGWELLTGFSNNEYALLHTGKDPGVSTLAIIFPESKNGYLIFLNGDNASKIYEHLLTSRLFRGAELWDRR